MPRFLPVQFFHSFRGNHGIAFDLGENVDRVLCVAAPIFDQHGRTVAGISVSGPTSRMESKLMAIRDDVRSAGVKISRMLGPLS